MWKWPYSDNKRPLSHLSEGEAAILCGAEGDTPLDRRLAELGWTRGTPVTCLCISPLGDPIAYVVRGGVVALRRSDAEQIFVCDG